MVHTKIKDIWDVFYVNPEEMAGVENASEVINQYKDDQIPIRILQLSSWKETSCIILAGEGALYPWKRGQKVELGFAQSFIWHIKYLRELCIKGIDNSPYQNFVLYDTIKPVREGEYFADKDGVEYKGISSFDLYTALGKGFLETENNDEWKL